MTHKKKAAAPIAALRKVAGQAAMGREVGTPGDNPHWGGFERTAERTKLESGCGLSSPRGGRPRGVQDSSNLGTLANPKEFSGGVLEWKVTEAK
jgi:hypothetical protein